MDYAILKDGTRIELYRDLSPEDIAERLAWAEMAAQEVLKAFRSEKILKAEGLTIDWNDRILKE